MNGTIPASRAVRVRTNSALTQGGCGIACRRRGRIRRTENQQRVMKGLLAANLRHGTHGPQCQFPLRESRISHRNVQIELNQPGCSPSNFTH